MAPRRQVQRTRSGRVVRNPRATPEQDNATDEESVEQQTPECEQQPRAAQARPILLTDEQFRMFMQSFGQAPPPAAAPPVHAPERVRCIEEARLTSALKKHDVPIFDGSSIDPELAERWVDNVERSFGIIGCADEFKVHCGVYLLRDEAYLWWQSVERAADPETPLNTWEQFRENFYDKYLPALTRFKLAAKFQNLVQGNMTVSEYERKFDSYSKYAPEDVNTPQKKLRRFIIGLREGLLGAVVAHTPTDYSGALRTALLIESNHPAKNQDVPNQGQSSRQKRKVDQLEDNQEQQLDPRQHQGRTLPQQGYTYPQCSTCKKYHQGKCLKGKCFECGQEGHIAIRCPTKVAQINQRQAP